MECSLINLTSWYYSFPSHLITHHIPYRYQEHKGKPAIKMKIECEKGGTELRLSHLIRLRSVDDEQ